MAVAFLFKAGVAPKVVRRLRRPNNVLIDTSFSRNRENDVSIKIRRGCVKRFFTTLRAKLNLDGDIFLLIMIRKMRKKKKKYKG